MHILYIYQYFASPSGSTGTRAYEFARRWVSAGNKVTVITGRYDLAGLQVPRGLVRRVTVDGIDVIVIGIGYSNKQSFVRRVWSFLSFACLSCIVGLFVPGIDIVYATSTPLSVGLPALVLHFIRRLPYVFEVRDQWPEIPIEMGLIKSGVIANVLLWFEKVIYRHSSAIVATSPGQADGVQAVATRNKLVAVVPNCADLEIFGPQVNGEQLRERHGWVDKTVFVHIGAMGRINSLHFVLDAAARVGGHTDALFVLIGGGSEKAKLQRRIVELGLDNVVVLEAVPKKTAAAYFAAADVGLVIIGNYPIVEHNSANKFFDTLSSGKPVLLNYSGWQRVLLEREGAGLGGDLFNLDQFVANVEFLCIHPEKRIMMGQNARRLAERDFGRDLLAGKVLGILRSVHRNR